MINKTDMVLGGCRPEPLISYLKALGIFRIVAEQVDADARSYWSGEDFHLVSSCSQNGLVDFFLMEYKPTPLISPWNGGSGFYGRHNQKAIDAIVNSKSPRLKCYRDTILRTQNLLKDMGISTKPKKRDKEKLLKECRNCLPDKVVQWLDATFVLSLQGPSYSPILGTGANDCNLEFTNNFMQRLIDTIPFDKKPSSTSSRQLEAALFGRDAGRLVEGAVGQFFPGGIGGPNATQGFEGSNLINPWASILMMEGTLFFAGSVVRRLNGSIESLERAAFPFTVNTTPAGWTSIADSEVSSSNGELWVPLWNRPAKLCELEYLFAEARVEVGRKQAKDGLDFARATVLFGIDRGISSFQRYGLFKRSGGRYYIAAPLCRLSVTARREADLLLEADAWLSALQEAARKKDAPAELRAASRRVEDAIFQFCLHGGVRQLQDILSSMGRAEIYVSKSESLQKRINYVSKSESLQKRIKPLYDLSIRWLESANDNSTEFRLAAALASIDHSKLGGIRTNLEPVERKSRRYYWADRLHSVVWTHGNLKQNLGAILERRLVDAEIIQSDESPLGGYVSASLKDIHDFLQGNTDDSKLNDLILGLATLKWNSEAKLPITSKQEPPATISRPYALLKLLFLSQSFRWGEAKLQPVLDLEVIHRLRRADVKGACRIAARRLRASGVVPMTDEFDAPRDEAERILAALLFPISSSQVFHLASLVLRKPAKGVAGE